MSEERYDQCWHCANQLEPDARPRCDFCPDECILQ